MPAGTIRRHSFIHRFSQGQGRISRSAHNLAGPGALGSTAHFDLVGHFCWIKIEEEQIEV